MELSAEPSQSWPDAAGAVTTTGHGAIWLPAATSLGAGRLPASNVDGPAGSHRSDLGRHGDTALNLYRYLGEPKWHWQTAPATRGLSTTPACRGLPSNRFPGTQRTPECDGADQVAGPRGHHRARLPSKSARRGRWQPAKSQVIGVVTLSSTLYGPASTLATFAQAAIASGFTVSVESVHTLQRGPMQEAISHHLDQRVAGLIVIAPVESASEVIDNVPNNVPLVCIDGDPQLSADLVTIHQEAGGYAATSHLLQAGHQTVWHVSAEGMVRQPWPDRRVAACPDRGGRGDTTADHR